MQVIAFDPGPHLGYAWFDGWELKETGTLHAPDSRDASQIYLGASKLLRRLAFALFTFRPEGDILHIAPTYADRPVVVIERFRTFSPAVSASNDGVLTAKLCGFLEGTALEMNYQVVWQNASERMPYVRAAREAPHRSEHEVSAVAHAFCYLERRQKATGDV